MRLATYNKAIDKKNNNPIPKFNVSPSEQPIR